MNIYEVDEDVEEDEGK